MNKLDNRSDISAYSYRMVYKYEYFVAHYGIGFFDTFKSNLSDISHFWKVSEDINLIFFQQARK